MTDQNIFQVGEVAKILNVRRSRIVNWMQGRTVRLVPSVREPKGQGSAALFSREDLYKVALADKLLAAGQSGNVVQQVIDSAAGHLSKKQLVKIFHKLDGPRWDKPTIEWTNSLKTEDALAAIAQFVLNVEEVRKEVDRAIASYRR